MPTYDNDFDPILVSEGGKRRNAIRITCSVRAEGCAGTDVSKITKGHTRTQFMAEKIFRNRKWTIGKDRSQDVCPSCSRLRESKKSQPVQNALVLYQPPVEAPAQAPVEQTDTDFIVEYVRSHMEEVPGTILWRYKDGHTDGSLYADLVRDFPYLTYMKLKILRARHIGNTRIRRAPEEVQQEKLQKKLRLAGPAAATSPSEPPPPQSPPPDLLARLEALEGLLGKVEMLETTVKERDRRIEKLELSFKQQEALMLAMKDRLLELSDDLDEFLAADEVDERAA